MKHRERNMYYFPFGNMKNNQEIYNWCWTDECFVIIIIAQLYVRIYAYFII